MQTEDTNVDDLTAKRPQERKLLIVIVIRHRHHSSDRAPRSLQSMKTIGQRLAPLVRANRPLAHVARELAHSFARSLARWLARSLVGLLARERAFARITHYHTNR